MEEDERKNRREEEETCKEGKEKIEKGRRDGSKEKGRRREK